MAPARILGAVVFVVGAVLLIFGFQAADSPIDQLSETFTGRYTEGTMWYLVLGVAGLVGGALLFLFGARR